MSGLIPIKLPALIKEFQNMDHFSRTEFMEFMEWVCEKFHTQAEDMLKLPHTDPEISAILEVENIAVKAYQILLHIHDPVASFDKPISEDAS